MDFYTPDRTDYPRLLDVWESSVRATHHFLPEPYIVRLRTLLQDQYLDSVTLFCTRDQDLITGFAGVGDGRLQMLFIAAEYRGKGLGSQLLQHAIDHYGIDELDVNEQNPQALGFYLRHGFRISGRTSVDGLGQPYPMLRMKRPLTP